MNPKTQHRSEHDRDERLYYTVPEAGAIAFGFGKTASYAAAKRGDLPTIRLGSRRLVVPRGELLKRMGYELAER